MIERVISIAILLCLFFITFSLKPKGEREISSALFWQYFWIAFAVANPLGLSYSPSSSIPFIVLSFLGFSIGYSYAKGSLYVVNPEYLKNEENRHNRLVRSLLYILIPVFLFLSVKAFYLIQTTAIYAYRREVYQNPEMLFGYAPLFPIFQLVIEGGLLILILSSFYSYIFNGKKSLLVLALIISSLFSMIFLGRYPIYRLIIMMIFFSIGFNRNYKFLIRMILTCVILGGALISFSIFRGNGVYGVSEIFIKHVFGYHTFGYHLFESFLSEQKEGFLDNTWLGGASLGSFGYFIFKPFSFLLGFDTYLQSEDYISQDIFINLGVYEFSDASQMELLANAFYTIFREIYVDYSYLGIVFFIGIGVFSRYCFLRYKLGDIYGTVMLMYIVFIFLFLGMRNPILRHEVVLPALYLIFMLIKTRRNFKYV